VAVNTEYTIRYYRSQEWAERFTQAGIHKSASWVTSRTRYAKREQAATGCRPHQQPWT